MTASNGVLIAAGWRRRQLDTMIRRQLTWHTKNARLMAKTKSTNTSHLGCAAVDRYDITKLLCEFLYRDTLEVYEYL